jgi:hypothetical protein
MFTDKRLGLLLAFILFGGSAFLLILHIRQTEKRINYQKQLCLYLVPLYLFFITVYVLIFLYLLHFSENPSGSPKASLTPTPTPKIPNKQPQDNKPLSVWFLDDNPTFNCLLDNVENNKPTPELEMVFRIEVFNNTNKEYNLTFSPDYGDAKISKNWSFAPLGIEPITANITSMGENEFVLDAGRHFIFNAHVIIRTDDPAKPAFKESFYSLSPEIIFGIIVNVGHGKTYPAYQHVHARSSFLGNLDSNWKKFTDHW